MRGAEKATQYLLRKARSQGGKKREHYQERQ